MKKLLQLTRTLLVAVCLLGGASFAWGADFVSALTTPLGTVGLADNSSEFWQYHSMEYVVPDGETYTVEMTNYTAGVGNHQSFNVVINNGTASYNGLGGTEYLYLRNDNFGWATYYDNAKITNGFKISDSNTIDDTSTPDGYWAAYRKAMAGAHVKLSVTRNGNKFSVAATITPANTELYPEFTYTYAETTVEGLTSLGFTLTIEGGHLDITKAYPENYKKAVDAEYAHIQAHSNNLCTPATYTSFYNGSLEQANWATASQTMATEAQTWAKANISSTAAGTDYTLYLNNAGFETGSLNGWSIHGNAATGGSDADNNGTIEDTYVIDGAYHYYTGWHGRNVSQSISGLPAGKYRLTARVSAWYDATVRLFANGTLSANQVGSNQTPSLLFNVTGEEVSCKLGIGGIGNEDDTDNTWGTTGYRVDNFILTVEEPVTSQKIYAKIGANKYLIKTIDLVDKYTGDQVTITYPRFWLVGTTLYSTAENAHGDGYYKWNYTLDGNDIEIEYTEYATNIVYFSEGENILGMTADASSNADIRCSEGQGGRSDSNLSLTTLSTGVYKLASRVWGASGVTYTYKAAGGDILAHATSGALNDNIVIFSVVSGSADIKVQGSSDTGGRVIDYVYIQKIADADVSVFNGDFSDDTWNAGWNGTGTNKANAFVNQTSSQTWGASGNFAEMWTNSGYSVEANIYQVLVNVPAGSYTLSADILNNVSSSGGVLYAKVGSASDVTTAAENASGANESVSFTVAETSNVELGFKTTALTDKKGWIAMDNFEIALTSVPVTINKYEWATFVSDKDLDFTDSDVKAYVVTNRDGTSLVMNNDVKKIPANIPLLLNASEGTYFVPVTDDPGSIATNLLQAGTGAVVSAEEGKTKYVLSINDNGTDADDSDDFAEFQKIVDVTATVPVGKAYLEFNEVISAPALSFMFNENTGINTVQTEGPKLNGAYYNLNGQRVAQPTKGLYIVNGKKVVVR